MAEGRRQRLDRRGEMTYCILCVIFLSPWLLVTASDSRLRDGGADGNRGDGTTPPAGEIRLNFEMENMTEYEGETIRIGCEITGGPLPEYRWYRNNIPISEVEQSDPRYNARPTMWGSRLRIQNLKVSDTGLYRCEGWNRWGRKSTQASLIVLRGPNPKPKGGGRDASDDDDDLDLDVDPDDDEIIYHEDYDPHLDAIPAGDPKLFPDSGVGDTYNPDTGQADPGTSNAGTFEGIYSGPKQKNGFCQEYRGLACSKFIADKSIYVVEQEQQGRMEERMTAALMMIAESSELSPQCGEYAIPTLCYYAFPVCDEATQKPRQICKDECEILEQVVCKKEFDMARQHHLMGHDFVLPNCAELPEITSPEGRQCVRIGLQEPPPDVAQTRSSNQQNACYTDNGSAYRGDVHTTVSGYTCQKWSEITPHKHAFSVLDFPQLGDHNQCRNPNNQDSGPWCYTTNSNVRKELCNIPKCVGAAKKKVNTLLLVMVPSLAVIGALAVLLLVVCLCRKTKHTSKPLNANTQVEMNALLTKQKVRAREFAPSSLRLTKTLGDTSCGKIYNGDLLGYYSDNTIISVIVKALQEDGFTRTQHDFYRELEVLTDIKHPNIVSLLGVKLKDKPACMIFEQHSEINMQQYLVKHSPQSEMYENEGHILNYNELLHVVTQIASGMEYLTSHNYVHRDLATRNVFINKNLIVKISNLGLLQEAYLSDYYRVPNCETQLPVRWMPIEAILYGKIGMESDVWSYGIVLWEIFSYGLQPYYGYNDQEVIDMIQARQILPCPDDCPSPMYALMIECWHEVALRRPTFKDIHTRLIHWKADAIINQTSMNVVNYGPISGPPSQSNSSHRSVKTPSHQGSTGPSNNTGSTGLTPNGQAIHYANNIYPQNGHVHPAFRQPYINTQSPYYPPQHAQHDLGRGYNMHSPKYTLPSPPGSVTSYRSSSIQSSAPSSASNAHNCKQYGFNPALSMPYSQPHDQPISPRLDSKSSCSKPHSNDSGMYIPDMRAQDI